MKLSQLTIICGISILFFINNVNCDTCHAASLIDCGNTYAACTSTVAIENFTHVCLCYRGYGRCLFDNDCNSGISKFTFLQACTAAGCLGSQCEIDASISIHQYSVMITIVSVILVFLFSNRRNKAY